MTAGNSVREAGDDPAQGAASVSAPSILQQLERLEGRLRWSALLLMVLLAATLALLSWKTIHVLPQRLEALPFGLVLLVILFGAYTWSKSREMARLRGLVRGLVQRAEALPRKQQLEQLFALIASSQQGFRDLIDTFDDLLFSLSLEGEIRAANRSLAQLFGRPFHEVIGHRLDEFLDHPEGSGRATAEKALPRLLEKGHWSGVICVRLKGNLSAGPGQGAVRYFDCALNTLVKNSRVAGFTGLAREVTQQRESEARFTELFETLQEGVYFMAPDGKLLDANPALVRMLGYDSKEELLGVKVTHPFLDASQGSAELEELARRGAARGREITLRRRDGSPVFCLHTSTAIRDPSGRIIRYQGTLLDVTRRREMEKRLHSEQEFARRLMDSFPDLIAVLDPHGRFTFLSPRITEALGYRPEELLGQSLGHRTHPEDFALLLQQFNDLVVGKRDHAILEYRARHKQGDWRLLRASASPFFDDQDRIAGVIASARDITELRRLEQQVIQSERLAAMGQMIAGVAHELNNPLTAILGVSELLRERTTDEAARRHLDLAHRQARRAAHIVQNLLVFSRPVAPGKVRLNVAELIERTLQLHEQSLRANKIAVDFKPRPNLPAVSGDANQLMQVFLNLITNAEQAIREARDSGTLQIRVGRVGNRILATFQDDGPGIPSEVLPRLFDPFFTTKRPGRGTGLGLSICMAIVREHGGNIEARALPKGGSLFSIALPVVGDPQPVPLPLDLSASQPHAASLQGLSILVVDDEESIRESVQDGLSARGMIVDCASTGEQAIELAAGRAYDAVLCDLHLAGSTPEPTAMSGQKVFEHLVGSASGRAPGSQKPLFIFMTGSLVDPARIEAFSQGGRRMLQKPFRISELLAILSEALEGTATGEPEQNLSG